MTQPPYVVKSEPYDAGDKAPLVGVNQLEFSPGGRYLASRNGTPKTLAT